MAIRRRRSSPVVPGANRPALRQLQAAELEQLHTTNDVCTYWTAIRPMIPSAFCCTAYFSSMKTRQSTCLSVTNLHAIINPWWNSEPFGRAGPSASFSPTNKWLLWRTVCLQYVTPCVSVGTVSSSSSRVATFVYPPPGGTAQPGCLWAPSTTA